jgi:hypothetical protein
VLFLFKTKPYKSSEQTSYKNGFCFRYKKPYKSSEQTSYKNGFCFCYKKPYKSSEQTSTKMVFVFAQHPLQNGMNKQTTTTTTLGFVVLFKTEELGEHHVHDEQTTNYTRT